MRVMKFISVMMLLIMIPAIEAPQDPAQNAPSFNRVPISSTLSNSGKELFGSYCAVCHGKDAKGNGPATSALKVPPPDLTLLAQKNGGKYPAPQVAAVIRGQATLPAHGTRDMPMWGPVFSTISEGREAQVQQRISNLVGYLESVQAK